MVKCPKDLPVLTDGTGQDVVLTMKDWASQYHKCAIRQRGLVDVIDEATP